MHCGQPALVLGHPVINTRLETLRDWLVSRLGGSVSEEQFYSECDVAKPVGFLFWL